MILLRWNEILSARAMVSDGVFTAADALACGYDRQSLNRLVSRGEAVRIGRGSYASRMTYAQASSVQRHRLATRAAVARSDGRLAASHFSALSLLELPLWRARLGQVQMARLGVGRGRRTSRICIHAGYGPSAYSLVDGILCVSTALAVLERPCSAGSSWRRGGRCRISREQGQQSGVGTLAGAAHSTSGCAGCPSGRQADGSAIGVAGRIPHSTTAAVIRSWRGNPTGRDPGCAGSAGRAALVADLTTCLPVVTRGDQISARRVLHRPP